MNKHGFKKVEKSQTLLLNEQSRVMEGEGKTVFKFGFGQSPFSPPERVQRALANSVGRKLYPPIEGVPELREKVARFHSKVDGYDVSADQVMIGAGSKILIYTILASFQEAEVVIPSPAWVSYEPQSRLLGYNVYRIEAKAEERWRVTPENLREVLDRRERKDLPVVLILNYPGNPDGLTYTEGELKALAEVCREYEVTVISDEIYGLLDHEGEHKSLGRYYPEGSFVTGGLSKWCGAGGWRLGIVIMPKNIPEKMKEAMHGIASETYSCASSPIQYAALEAYEYGPEVEDFLAHERRILKLLGGECHRRLKEAGIGVHKGEGGFYLFLDLEGIIKNETKASIDDVCALLLKETGVALLASSAFGTGEDVYAARLAYVDFDGNKALEASREIGLSEELDRYFLESYCGKVLEGVDVLCNWVKERSRIAVG